MQDGLADYIALAATARAAHHRGDERAAMADFARATGLMHETILANADRLDAANNAVLDRVYADRRAGATATLWLALLAGAILVGALLWVQWFLYRRMKRLINPPLLLATVVAVAYVAYTAVTLNASAHELKVAKQDAFASILVLWEARAVSFDANADESRCLLPVDPAARDAYQRSFIARSARVVQLPAGASFATVAASAESGALPAGFGGYLANELNNITFVGERAAAVAALRAYGVYYGLDSRIRALQNRGHHAAAVAFDTGYAPVQSDWAYSQFDDRLGDVIDINQRAFDQAVARGFADLDPFGLLGLAVPLAIALLCLVGLLPRIGEASL